MVEKILIAYAVWNLAVMLIYGVDKLLAKLGARRIPERVLFSVAIVFGACGAWAGIRIFRHKTRKKSFVYVIPILAFVNVAVIFFALQKAGF